MPAYNIIDEWLDITNDDFFVKCDACDFTTPLSNCYMTWKNQEMHAEKIICNVCFEIIKKINV